MTTLAHPRSWLERRRARHEADVWIRRGFESRYPWRLAELTSARERRSCARCVRSVFDELEGRRLPGATPLQGRALVADVAKEAVEQELFETWALDQVSKGASLPGLYPPNEETKAKFEAFRKKG